MTEDDVETHIINGETNICVIVGPPSGGLVDIDLGCPEAPRLALNALDNVYAGVRRYS